ncbi:MAG: hypothetical protein JXQ99_14315 [Hyphomicrobiaceae bacterium]
MKKIEVIVEAGDLRSVCNALLGIGIDDLIVTDCASSGARPRIVMSYRTAAWVPDLKANYLIEVIVPRDSVPEVLRQIGGAKGQGDAHDLDGLRISSIDEIISIQGGDRSPDDTVEWRCDRTPISAQCEHDGS